MDQFRNVRNPARCTNRRPHASRGVQEDCGNERLRLESILIPEPLKRLAGLRMEGTHKEVEHSRYKLVEEETPPVKDERP
jgi:hypothetical protein